MAKKKNRNYSFKSGKRLKLERMIEVNGVKIPSWPGSCFHAIICSLAENKDNFCSWDRIFSQTEKYMRQYGGPGIWELFVQKDNDYKQRIKDNTHTLTRAGKDCYGYRLHELGMCIYFFKDGAVLYTDGDFVKQGSKYTVKFHNGRELQSRYRGTNMSFKEYRLFLDFNWIDINGTILKTDEIKKHKLEVSKNKNLQKINPISTLDRVSIKLADSYSQDTAYRLESYGLEIEEVLQDEYPARIIGNIPTNNIDSVLIDEDILDIEIIE